MISQDYIIRIIQQVVEAIARMIGKREQGDYQGALRQAEAAYDLLGIPPDLAAAMDSESLADLLGNPEKIRMMARLSQQEGEVYRATGDPLTGTARFRRAAELMLEARIRDPRPEDAGVLQELFRHFPTASLAAKYRGVADTVTDRAG